MMTDEQVKKGLKLCAQDGTIIEICKAQCPYYKDCHKREGNSNRIYSDALALIKRLEKANVEIANDILQYFAQFRTVSPTFSSTWHQLAKKYGVEV